MQLLFAAGHTFQVETTASFSSGFCPIPGDQREEQRTIPTPRSARPPSPPNARSSSAHSRSRPVADLWLARSRQLPPKMQSQQQQQPRQGGSSGGGGAARRSLVNPFTTPSGATSSSRAFCSTPRPWSLLFAATASHSSPRRTTSKSPDAIGNRQRASTLRRQAQESSVGTAAAWT